jgi:hypothetical protein
MNNGVSFSEGIRRERLSRSSSSIGINSSLSVRLR